MSGKSVDFLDKFVEHLSKIFMLISMAMLLAMMFLGGFDVIGRYFFNRPIQGTFEITEILLAGIVFFGVGFTQRIKRHAVVDFVYARLPPRIKAVVGLVNNIVILCIFSMIIWRGTESAFTQYARHREIPNLGLPSFPFQLFVPLGALIMCFVLVAEILQYFKKAKTEK